MHIDWFVRNFKSTDKIDFLDTREFSLVFSPEQASKITDK